MGHQKLRCYWMLLEIAKAVPALIRRLPRGNGHIIDQLKRALESSILNLCEGNGSLPCRPALPEAKGGQGTSIKERNRFFDISLGSLAEVDSCFGILAAYGYITPAYEHDMRCDLIVICKMIENLKS